MNTRNIGNEAKINPKTGRIDQACERYGVGRSTMRRIAEESGAVVKVGIEPVKTVCFYVLENIID